MNATQYPKLSARASMDRKASEPARFRRYEQINDALVSHRDPDAEYAAFAWMAVVAVCVGGGMLIGRAIVALVFAAAGLA